MVIEHEMPFISYLNIKRIILHKYWLNETCILVVSIYQNKYMMPLQLNGACYASAVSSISTSTIRCLNFAANFEMSLGTNKGFRSRAIMSKVPKS